MNDNKLLQKQKGQFLFYNLIAFFIIFMVLGFLTVSAIESYFYRSADEELRKNSTLFYEQVSYQLRIKLFNEKPVIIIKNPRINHVLYDQKKVRIYCDLQDFINTDLLDVPTGVERIYNKDLDEYSYRIMEYSFNIDNNPYYAQILINIDGEISLRNNIISIYLICLATIIILTVLTSYFLSGITMIPITKSLESQARFVSDASHELRTPLTILHSKLEQLLSSPDEKIIDKSEDLSHCLSEVIRLTKLSNSLLSLAKSDTDKVINDLTEFDIYDLICKVASPYLDIAAMQDKQFCITGSSVLIKADKTKLKQLFIILFDNALKYTNAGDKIDISLKQIKSRCEITVSDTGIGISEKGLNKVFDRFYRDDNSRGKTEGHGLGLSIAKQIVKAHNGIILAKQNQPKGAKFVITL